MTVTRDRTMAVTRRIVSTHQVGHHDQFETNCCQSIVRDIHRTVLRVASERFLPASDYLWMAERARPPRRAGRRAREESPPTAGQVTGETPGRETVGAGTETTRLAPTDEVREAASPPPRRKRAEGPRACEPRAKSEYRQSNGELTNRGPTGEDRWNGESSPVQVHATRREPHGSPAGTWTLSRMPGRTEGGLLLSAIHSRHDRRADVDSCV
jgi:hypothetical protein